MKRIFLSGLLLAIVSCTPDSQQATQHGTDDTPHPHDLQPIIDELAKDQALDDEPIAKPITTKDGKIQIDWSYILTKTAKADMANYNYPIALDSQAVKNYAKQYNISDKQAQHSIVVGMAAPEALGKVLDQLGSEYRGHELQDGADMALIIHVSDKVVSDNKEYVFADKFGQGLSMPVIIKPVKK